MKPPSLKGLLKRFDSSIIGEVFVERHLGIQVDPRTGIAVDQGYSQAAKLVPPYTFVPVEGDMSLEVFDLGDRFRDPRWLWCSDDLSPGTDGEGDEARGDVVVSGGERYLVVKRLDSQALTEFSGYLVARRAT